MIPTTKFAVSSVQVSQLPIGCNQIEGYFKGGAGAWLQVHDSCITPAAGAVPLYELPLNAMAQFQETLQVANMTLNEGLFIGVSSSEGTYTASASTMDITVWTDVIPIATNVVGDKTTQITTLQVWDQAVTNKVIYGLIVTNTSGSTQTVYINAVNGTTLYSNQGALFTLNALGATKKYFGANLGLTPIFNDVNNVIGGGPSVVYNGCTILMGQVAAQNGNAVVATLAVAILAITN